MGELVDFEKERARLSGELETAKSELERASARVANENFVSKAPKAVVDAERAKVEKYKDRIATLEAKLRELAAM